MLQREKQKKKQYKKSEQRISSSNRYLQNRKNAVVTETFAISADPDQTLQ